MALWRLRRGYASTLTDRQPVHRRRVWIPGCDVPRPAETWRKRLERV